MKDLHHTLRTLCQFPILHRDTSGHVLDSSAARYDCVWNVEPLGLRRKDEPKAVTADVEVGDGLLDLRHVARHALASFTAAVVISLLLECRRVQTVRRTRAVALQAHHVGRPCQVGGIARPVDIVTTEARHAVRVHGARRIIVSLHPILVSRAVGKVRERGLAGLVVFQSPERHQIKAHMDTDWPLVILPVHRVLRD
jgi:hypothetical protein